MTLIYAPVPYIFTKQIHAVEASYLIPDCMVDVVLPFLKPFFSQVLSSTWRFRGKVVDLRFSLDVGRGEFTRST